MFFRAARLGDNSFFRYVLTLLAVIVGSVIGQIPLVLLMADYGAISLEGLYQEGASENYVLAMMLLSFAGGFGGLYLGVRYFHHKPFRAIFTGRSRLDWDRIGFAFWLWLGLTILLEVVSYFLAPEAYRWNFDPLAFPGLVLVSLLLLPVQTTFEEAVFRGYLMQGFGLWFRYRWLSLLLTSVLFGALHFMNPEILEFGALVMMGYYIGVGAVLGIATLMDEGTELAIGLHAATNIYGAVVVGYQGSALRTPALFMLDGLNAPLMLLMTALASAAFLVICARRYRWGNWKKLGQRISPATEYVINDQNRIDEDL